MPLNPYVAGKPVGGSKAFVGRADLLRDVTRMLRSPYENALVFYGQRSIGKTSFLQELAVQLPKIGPYQPIYFDLRGKKSSSKNGGHPEFALSAGGAFRDDLLTQFLTQLSPEHSLVLLFDEFDLPGPDDDAGPETTVFPNLHNLLTLNPQQLQAVFVIGRHPEAMPPEALSIFKEIKTRPVLPLSAAETAELVCLSEQNGTLRWSPEAVEAVYSLTGGHPFLTQQLCQEVWEQAYRYNPDGPPPVRPYDVETAVPQTLHSAVSTLEWIWSGWGPAERLVALATAEAGPGPISRPELNKRLQELGIRALIGELQDAPRLLAEFGVIEPDTGGYHFRIELLRRWIAGRKSRRLVQDEVNHIEPVAASLYRAAHRHYQAQAFEQAIPLLRQAIGLNPNHVQATQLLAEILLARGELSPARQLLESLYEYQPDAARPRLVQALLLQARQATGKEQLALYEQVLQLEPDHPEAATGRRRIWEHQGNQAAAQGDLETALHAYKQAGLPEKVIKTGLQHIDRLEEAGQHSAAFLLAQQLYVDYPAERHRLPPLLVAEILLEQGEIAEAERHLENLYHQQPDAVCPLLVKALLLQADALSHQSDQLTLYDRILQLDPSQPEATAKRRQIWAGRGQAALAANDLETAAAAFREANMPEKAAEIEQELHRCRLEEGLREMARLEQEGDYQAALNLARQLHSELPEPQQLPPLAPLERKARLDDLYRRALVALQDGDNSSAELLLVQVVALEPGYRDATRYLHLITTGVDIAEVQNQLQQERRARLQAEAAAREAGAGQAQLKAELVELKTGLETETVTRQEFEAIAKKETGLRRQREAELKQLQHKLEAAQNAQAHAEADLQTQVTARRRLETELNAVRRRLEAETLERQKTEAAARQEASARQQYQAEVQWLKKQFESEQAARREAEARAQAEAELRYQHEAELEQLRTQLEAARKQAEQQARFAAVNARREIRAAMSGRPPRPDIPQQETLKPLSPWNPLDHVRLVWWLFRTPERVRIYKLQYGRRSLHRVGKWPVSLLIWLPILIPTLALGLGTLPRSPDAWPPATYFWLSGALALICLLTGWLGDSDHIASGLALTSLAFVGAVGATTAVAGGLAFGVLNDFITGLSSSVALLVAIGVAFIVQGNGLKLGTVVIIGVAIAVAIITLVIRIGYVTGAVIIDIPTSMLGGLAGSVASSFTIGIVVWIGEKLSRGHNKWLVVLFGLLIVGIPGTVAGAAARLASGNTPAGLTFGIAFGLANAIIILIFVILGTLLSKKGVVLKRDYSTMLAHRRFGVLLLIYVFIAWHALVRFAGF